MAELMTVQLAELVNARSRYWKEKDHVLSIPVPQLPN